MRALKSAKGSVKRSVSTRVLAVTGRVRKRLPAGVDVDTGELATTLSQMSSPARRRVANQLEDIDTDTWRAIYETGVDHPSAKVAKVLKHTGDKGQNALAELSGRGKAALLRLADNAHTTRALVGAWKRDEISSSELGRALRRVDEFDAGQQLLLDTGDEGAVFLARVDKSTVRRVVADGSGELDRKYGRAMARALDNEVIDTEDIHGAARAVRTLDDPRPAKRLVADADVAGVRLLADADSETVEEIVSLDIDTSGTGVSSDLDERVRVGLAREYSRNHFTLDGWAGDVYPDAESSTEVAGKIAADLDELNDNPNVEGLGRVVSKEGDGGTGSYLVGLPGPGASDNPVKGAALEVRVARRQADDLNPDETLELSYEPDVDLTELEGNTDALGDIAKRVYGTQDDTDLVKRDLGIGSGGKDAEFDVLRVSSNSNRDTIYFEAKNRGNIKPDDMESQASRYLATRIVTGDTDLSDTEMVVITRTESQASDLNNALDGDWFTARAPET